MKIQITLKDPDGVSESVSEHIRAEVGEIKGLTSEERQTIVDTRVAEVFKKLRPWVKFGEYVTIEIDTDDRTAAVIENK